MGGVRRRSWPRVISIVSVCVYHDPGRAEVNAFRCAGEMVGHFLSETGEKIVGWTHCPLPYRQSQDAEHGAS